MFSNSVESYVLLNFEFTIGCSTGLLALLACFPKIAPIFNKQRIIRFHSAFGGSDTWLFILFTKIGIYIHPIGHLRSSTLLWMNDCEPWFMYGDCGELAQGDTTENFQVWSIGKPNCSNDEWQMTISCAETAESQRKERPRRSFNFSQTVQMMNDEWRMKMNVSLLLQTHSVISVILHSFFWSSILTWFCCFHSGFWIPLLILFEYLILLDWFFFC